MVRKTKLAEKRAIAKTMLTLDEFRSEVARILEIEEYDPEQYLNQRTRVTIIVLKKMKTGHCYVPAWAAELLKLYQQDAHWFGIELNAKHEAYVEMPPPAVREKAVRNARKK